MKVVFVLSLMLFSCKIAPKDNLVINSQDTVIINTKSAQYDSLMLTISNRIDSFRFVNETLKKQLKSKKDSLFIAQYKIGRIKYRIAICEKNAGLKKFFYGWTRRIVTD